MKRSKARAILMTAGLAVLTLSAVLTQAPAPSALTATILAGLVGGGALACGLGYGLTPGLGISSRIAVISGVGAGVGVALGVAGIAVGFVTYAYC